MVKILGTCFSTTQCSSAYDRHTNMTMKINPQVVVIIIMYICCLITGHHFRSSFQTKSTSAHIALISFVMIFVMCEVSDCQVLLPVGPTPKATLPLYLLACFQKVNWVHVLCFILCGLPANARGPCIQQKSVDDLDPTSLLNHSFINLASASLVLQ